MPREVGAWTGDKLKILNDYLPGYLTATHRATERVYIDAFAGPGRNLVEGTRELIDGSPLIALSAKGRTGQVFDSLFFIENDAEAVEELRAAVGEHEGRSRATVIQGDVNTELPRLMDSISKRSPTFVLLDTEGVEPAWETIKSLAPWQTELLINFPLGMSINRNPDSAKTLAYFGAPDWREHWEGGRLSRTSGLIAFYLRRLAELGWYEQPDYARLVKTQDNKHLYYLLHASKHPAAKRIMDWAFGQPDSAGQGRMPL